MKKLLLLIAFLGFFLNNSIAINVPASGFNTVSCGTNTSIYDSGGAGGSYGNSHNGYTVLENAGTGVITLTGTYDTESGFDFLRIYSGTGTGGTLLATYNGGPGTITTIVSAAGQALTIQFTSDGSVTDVGFALSATYSGSCAASGVNVPASGFNTVSCGTNTSIYDSGGAGGSYGNSHNGYTVLENAGTGVITLTGTYDTESGFDFLRIYSGTGTGGTLLATYNGGPGTITTIVSAAGQALTIQFTSDGSVTDVGFALSATYSGSCAASGVNVPASGFNTVSCGTNTSIYDSGGAGGSYGNSHNGYTVLENAGTGVITLTGTYDTESGFDFLRIYSGTGTGGTLLATYNGGPGTITTIVSAAGQALTIQFTSDGSVTDVGFALSATYSGSCVTAPANDNCSTASAISIGGSASGDTGDPLATSDVLTCGTPDGTGAELWYTFTGNGGRLSLETTVGSYDTKLWLYDGCNFATDCIAGNDDGGVGTLSRIDFCSVNGQTYRVAVGGYAANEGTFTLTLTDIDANPVVSCPSNQSVSTGAACQYVHSGTGWDATATDDCGVSSITYALSGVTTGTGTSLDGVLFNEGVTTVTWTASDGLSNTDVCSFTVTVSLAVPTGVSAGSDVTICLGESTNLTGTATGPPVTLSGSSTFSYTGSGFDTDAFQVGGVISGLPAGAIITSMTYDATIVSEAECQLVWYDWDLYINGVFDGVSYGCTGIGFTNSSLNGQLANGQAIWLQGHDLDGFSDFITTLDFDLTINYDYPSIAPVTYSWTPIIGLSDPAIANPIANPTTSTIYTLTATSNGCSASDDVEITVRDASNNVVLVSGVTVSPAVEQCTEPDGWTYYATVANPDEYVFAVKKNGSVFTAEITISDLPGNTTYSSTGGAGPDRGTWLIGRHWNADIVSGSITNPVDIRFFIDNNELAQADAEATAFVNSTPFATTKVGPTFFKTTGFDFDPNSALAAGNFTFTPTYLAYSSGSTNSIDYIEMTGITSFSGGTGGFSVNDDGSSLPVELLSFEANAVENEYIQVKWSTATEINNDGFEVLRSENGIDFEIITWIDGHGNSSSIHDYLFPDYDVSKGITYYYQLKQLDFDGQYENTEMVSTSLAATNGFYIGNLIPNPSKDNDLVRVDIQSSLNELLKVQIYNHIGAQVTTFDKEINTGKNKLVIDVSDWASGTYFINFESTFGTETRKLVLIK